MPAGTVSWHRLLGAQPYPESARLRMHIPEGEVGLPISIAVHVQVPCHTWGMGGEGCLERVPAQHSPLGLCPAILFALPSKHTK